MLKSFICAALTIAFTLSPKAGLAFSGEQGEMIGTFDAMAMEERQTKEDVVKNYASKSEVRAMLEKQGLDFNQINERLATLSDRELEQLADSVEKGKAGALLVEIVLILLIIYLAKRI